MKHLLILISFLLLSSFLTSCDKKEETLYRWETSSGFEWKKFGEKKTHPTYEGDVENRIPNGLGIIFYPDGQKYEGELKDGRINGQGTLTEPNGIKYEGEWKEGIPHGKGTKTFPDGRKYVGEWMDGRPNGQGTKTYSDGSKFVGFWKDGVRWSGTIYDKNGNIIVKFVNGKQIKP